MSNKNEENFSLFIVILYIIFGLSYVINFFQLIFAVFDGNGQLAIVKLIGLVTGIGAIITVWF